MTSKISLTPDGATDGVLYVDVWADINCPWCYIGKARLERALAESEHASRTRVRVHPFELDPAASTTPSDILPRISQLMRVSLHEAEAGERRTGKVAEQEGLSYSPHRLYARSYDALRVVALAGQYDVSAELMSVLQRRHFSGDGDAYDRPFLVESAAALGIPSHRVEAVLDSREFADAMQGERSQALRMGATGVPFAVLDERIAIPGAASLADYRGALRRAWSTR